MKNLTPFEEKVLAVLIKLQYLCDVVESCKHNTKKGIIYSFGEFFPTVEGQGELDYVVEYLKTHGLDISVTFDVANDYLLNDPIYIKQYGEVDNVPLGLIKGENMEEIKKVIEKNIHKLNPRIRVEPIQAIKENPDIKGKKQKFTSKMKIADEYLFFGDEKIPVERGQKLMAQEFLDNAKIFRGQELHRKGTPLKIKNIRETSHYNNQKTFRDSLKRFRKKLRDKKWPVKVENPSTGKYQMVIKYNLKNKKQK